jgi:hypothetical protein
MRAARVPSTSLSEVGVQAPRVNAEQDGLLTISGFRYEQVSVPRPRAPARAPLSAAAPPQVDTRPASSGSDVLVRNCSSCQGRECIRIHGACRKLSVHKASAPVPRARPLACACPERAPPPHPTPLPTTHPTVLRAERDARAAQCNYLRVLCDETLEELSVSACDKVHTPPYCSPYRSP